MKKLIIAPDTTSYTVKDGVETIMQKLDGGTGRSRADILKSSFSVTCTWTLSRMKYEYLRAFYKGSASARGATPFLIDLVVDEAYDLTEHVAYFKPDTMTTPQVSGLTYTVSAELEVRPFSYPAGYYELIVLFYEEFGEDAPARANALLDRLAILMNNDIPDLPAWVAP